MTCERFCGLYRMRLVRGLGSKQDARNFAIISERAGGQRRRGCREGNVERTPMRFTSHQRCSVSSGGFVSAPRAPGPTTSRQYEGAARATNGGVVRKGSLAASRPSPNVER
jgi:hypothetical protein